MFEIFVNGVKTDVTSESQLLIKVLIEFINNTAYDWNKREDWENESACKQARALFTTIAFLMDCEPDTAKGDVLLLNIYTNSGLDKNVEYKSFDLFMWELFT